MLSSFFILPVNRVYHWANLNKNTYFWSSSWKFICEVMFQIKYFSYSWCTLEIVKYHVKSNVALKVVIYSLFVYWIKNIIKVKNTFYKHNFLKFVFSNISRRLSLLCFESKKKNTIFVVLFCDTLCFCLHVHFARILSPKTLI